MKKKTIWAEIIRITITVLTAILTSMGMQSCIALQTVGGECNEANQEQTIKTDSTNVKFN